MWSFHWLVITTPFLFTWVNEELFEFNKMLMVYTVAVVVGVSWLTMMIAEKKVIWRRTRLDVFIGLFVGSQIISTLLSIHPHTSLFGYYSRFHGGLLSTLSYVVLYSAAVTHFNWRELTRVMRSLLLAAAGVMLYAIPEHFGLSPSCGLITASQPGGPSFDVSCWIQDVQTRIFGTFGQPNWLAAYALMIVPLALSQAVLGWLKPKDSKDATKHWLVISGWVVLAVLSVTAIWFTKSRSGLLGLAAAGVVWAAFPVYWWWQRQKNRHFIAIPIALLMIVAVVSPLRHIFSFGSLTCFLRPNATFQHLQNPGAAENTGTSNRLDEGGTDSGLIRCIVWSGAVAVWQRYPLFGSGVETFAYSYYQDRLAAHNLVSEWDFLYNKAHNELLNFLSTTGAVGLTTYLGMLGAFVVGTGWLLLTKRRGKLNADQQWILVGWVGAIVGLSVSNFFGFSTVMVTVLQFLGFASLSLALLAYRGQLKAVTFSPARSSAMTPQLVALVGLALVTGYALITIINWWWADQRLATGKQYLNSGYVIEGLTRLETAARTMPDEALFSDELALGYAQVAAALALQGQSSAAAELADAAIQTSDRTIALNNRHLNFWKSRARVFTSLAQLDPSYLDSAAETLESARALSPTDAKLRYNLGLIKISQGQTNPGGAAEQELLAAIELRPNYDVARVALGDLYQEQGNWPAAAEQYQYILTYLNPADDNTAAKLASVSAQLQ